MEPFTPPRLPPRPRLRPRPLPRPREPRPRPRLKPAETGGGEALPCPVLPLNPVPHRPHPTYLGPGHPWSGGTGLAPWSTRHSHRHPGALHSLHTRTQRAGEGERRCHPTEWGLKTDSIHRNPLPPGGNPAQKRQEGPVTVPLTPTACSRIRVP